MANLPYLSLSRFKVIGLMEKILVSEPEKKNEKLRKMKSKMMLVVKE